MDTVARFDTASDAALAALMSTMLNFDTSSQEYGGNIYGDTSLWRTPNWHFGTYYFFSAPQTDGAENYVRIQNTVSVWDTQLGVYHTHPIDELEVFGGRRGDYDNFSGSDKWSAYTSGGSNFMGNETGTFLEWRSTGTPRIPNWDFGNGRYPGNVLPISGAPSREVFQRLKACREASML